jgi:hypothetical protein
MSSSIKNMLVIIAAFLIGAIIVYLGEACIHKYHPFFVNGVNPSDSLPAGVLALVLLFHAAGAFISGIILKKTDTFIITLVGLGWTLVGVVSILKVSQPIWYAISDTCIYLPMTLLGSKLVKK